MQKKSRRWQFSTSKTKGFAFILTVFCLSLSACSSGLQTRVSGNLDQISPKQTIAILPVEFVDKSQREAANMFRRILYANLKESKFNLLEPYLVDGLLKKNGLNQPEKFLQVNPMHLGEVLGVDAVLISRVNKMQRTYVVLHSSIELSVSLQMVDTRNGEILWRAEQTESDFQGLGKIPTGMTAAFLSPILFVTNKLNLNRLTSKMVNKLTAIFKHPFEAGEEKMFKEPVITASASRDIDRLKKVGQVKARWANKDLETSDDSRVQSASANSAPVPLKAGEVKTFKQPVIAAAESRDTDRFNKVEQIKVTRVNKGLEKSYEPRVQLASANPVLVSLETGEVKTFREPMITATSIRDNDRLQQVEGVNARRISKEKWKPIDSRLHLASVNLFPIPPVIISAGNRPVKKNAAKYPQPESEIAVVVKSKVHASQPLKLATKPPIFYTIQVGAYKTKLFAEKMIHSLAEKGYKAFMALLPSKDKTPLYRVRVEKFEDKNEARQLGKKLESKEHLDNFITTQSPG